MKRFNTLATKVLIYTLCVIALCACSSDNPVEAPVRLTDVDWKETTAAIYLNEECLENASVKFIEIQDTDSVTMILSGVNPTETIQMEVATARDKDGNIVFNGKKTDYETIITVDGVWQFENSVAQAFANSTVTVNISYRLAYNTLIPNYYVAFDGNRGLRHIRDKGYYPLIDPVVIEGQRDSCEYICRVINKEFAKSLSSLSINLGPSGILTVKYTTPREQEYEQQFRFWVRTVPFVNKNIIEVEDPERFYDFLFEALDLTGNKYVPESEVASIHVEMDGYYDRTRIMILDDLHYRIFGYINNSFAEKGLWEFYDRRYITLMYMGANTYYAGVEFLASYDHYRWCFSDIALDE